MIEKWSVGTQRIYIHTQGWHTFYFLAFMSVTVTWWHTWCSGWRQPSGRWCSLDLVEVQRFVYASSVSADSLLCHFGMEGSCLFDCYELLPGVVLSQPSPFDDQETQLLASSLL
jgi:hypothetical protein